MEGLTLNVNGEQSVFGNATVGNEAAVCEGDCLLLHGFTVWYEKKTGLPRLCGEENEGRARIWYVWKKNDDHQTDGDLAFGKRAWYELKELRRWWHGRKACGAVIVP